MKLSRLKSNLFFLFLFITQTYVCAQGSISKDFELDGIYYYINDSEAKTVSVTSPTPSNYNYYKDVVNIPATIEVDGTTYTVNKIQNQAFRAQEGLTNVILPKTLETIEYKAFMSCVNLKSIAFNTNGVLTTIEYNAFSGCKRLTSLNFPNSLINLGEYAFENCVGIKNIKGGQSIETISKAAFKGCDNLVEVELPNSLKYLGEMSFWGCASLRTISLGNSLETIGPDAFLDCNQLESIILPETVKTIGYEAFRGCWNLSEIKIPDSVTELGYGVFRFCVSLTKIQLGKSVTSIPSLAFEQTDLTSITIPNSVKTIGASAFSGCLQLEKVVFGTGLEEIRDKAFLMCKKLTKIDLPEPLISIGKLAFSECENLETATIPYTTYSIMDYAFAENPKLDNVYDLATVPQDIYDRKVFQHSGSNGYVNVHVYEGFYDIYSKTMGWYDVSTDYLCYLKLLADIPFLKIESIQILDSPIYCGIGEKIKVATKILPTNAAIKELSWESSDESVLYVDEFTGEIIGMSTGEATLTAKATDGSGVSTSSKVYVGMSGIASVSVDKPETTIIYDVYGRRRMQLEHGINIVNGKKIYIK